MSVLEQLKTYAADPDQGSFDRFETKGTSQQLTDMEATMQSVPIPGQSLTQDPDIRLPYETPPKYTDAQEFIDDSFLRFTHPDALGDLLDGMRSEIPLEFIAEKYLMRAFTQGEITPDVFMLSIESIIYILISLATYAEIEPVLYPEDDLIDTDEHMSLKASALRQASNDLLSPEEDLGEENKVTLASVTAPVVQPRSLVSRAKAAVEGVNDGSKS